MIIGFVVTIGGIIALASLYNKEQEVKKNEFSIVAEGLEGYASGRFQLGAEVKRFFEQFTEFPKNAKGEVSNEHVNRILSRVIYAGHIQSDIMDVSLRPAQNEPLISLATFQKIQQRMQEKAKIPARKNLNEDFPLRGAVR